MVDCPLLFDARKHEIPTDEVIDPKPSEAGTQQSVEAKVLITDGSGWPKMVAINEMRLQFRTGRNIWRRKSIAAVLEEISLLEKALSAERAK